MTDKMKKTAEDMSITLTKISISLLFIASIILIALGPWVVNLIIEFPSPFFQGETRFWILLLLGYVLGCLALACIVHLYRLLSRIGKNQVFITVHALPWLGSGHCGSYLSFYGTYSLPANALSHCFL